jgi:DNA-binding transcriptional ArsR family regulator
MRRPYGREPSALAETFRRQNRGMSAPRPDGRAAELARFAGLLADTTRATFLLALVDGRAWTAGELAGHARVAPSTATEHLNRLLEAGLVVQRRQGRHRYVQLAGPEVAHLLEDISATAAPLPAPVTSLRAASARQRLARGRTCYDHLAGQLGVGITDAMTGAGLLEQRHGFGITDAGLSWLTDRVGVNPATLDRPRRPLVRPCLDWTERRTHLGGVAGAQLCGRFLDHRWIERIGSSRAVRVTADGADALRDLLGFELAAG